MKSDFSSPEQTEPITTRHVAPLPRRRTLLDRIIERESRRPSGKQDIPRRKIGSYAPLSFAQQRLWFLDQLAPGNPVYNAYRAWRLCGELQTEALQRAIDTIVDRHEVLRSTVEVVDGQPLQLTAPVSAIALSIVDLQGFSPEEREAKSVELTLEESKRPFDLAKGPLFRAKLLRLADQEHILILNMHHIVADGWSLGVFHRELAVLYEAFAAGNPFPLRDLPIQYSDYASWQYERLQGDLLEKQLTYWKRQLAGLPVMALPTDRSRPQIPSYRGARETFQLSPSLTAQLRAFSGREGATLFMTLLAAVNVLLHRYTGQDDIVVGSPIANRTRAELEPLIGMVVNTLVLRTGMLGNPTFSELIARVCETCLAAYDHQDIPFEKLVEELQLGRDTSRNPLFQVAFTLQNAPDQALSLSGMRITPFVVGSVSPYNRGNDTAKFDLTVSMVEADGSLEGMVEYSTDLFDQASIQRMAGHLQTLLEGIVANPARRLSDLPMLTEAERKQLLTKWNDTKRNYPGDKCIHQLFEKQVERTPDNIAAVYEEQQLTYRELNCRANQLAHHLLGLGVKPETPVAICIERSLEMVVGLLGILKAGGAYVPLDPALPKDRLAFMLHDTQMPVLLTQVQLVEKLPESTARVVSLDRDWEIIAQERKDNPAATATADNLAYVIYTSGSTGRPKGVMIQHASLVNLTRWHNRAYKVAPTDRATQIASLSFDASVWELWPYLTAGASIHLPGEEAREQPSDLLRWLGKEGITICFLPTPLAETILEEQRPRLLALRTLLTGGDKLRQVPTRALPFELINNYGPTENTVVATWAPVISTVGTGLPPPIGRPIDNAQVYLLDACLRLVPVGIPGELYIGGDGLARGYFNRAELTAEKFIPNPFSNEPGARLYRTGDLARYLPDGNIEFLGRIDHQVKIRGFRIELGEIESVLGQHQGVLDVLVLVREDIPSGKRLVAYIVHNREQSITSIELRTFLKHKLPEYMVPSAFVFLDALPLTLNGKVDRRALPAPDHLRPELEAAYVPPKTDLERKIVQVWQEALGIEKVGVHDNFFDLGGHSLLIVQIQSKLSEFIDQEVSVIDMFRCPNISSLASYLSQEQNKQPPFHSIHDRAKRQKEILARQRHPLKKQMTRE